MTKGAAAALPVLTGNSAPSAAHTAAASDLWTTSEEKARAESLARGTGGMRPVRNLIQVIPDAGRVAALVGPE